VQPWRNNPQTRLPLQARPPAKPVRLSAKGAADGERARQGGQGHERAG